MLSLTYFYRFPGPIYFSIEKLFHGIAAELKEQRRSAIDVSEVTLPAASSLKTLRSNIRFVRSKQTAINHITGDVHYAILGCRNENLNILTIHDCVLLYQYSRRNPRYWIILWLWYRLPVRKADGITVISENTRQDLLRFTGCPPEKIKVIPNYLDPAFSYRPKPFQKAGTRLLFIGTAPNKNLGRLIESLAGLDVVLDIIGYPDENQLQLLKALGVKYTVKSNLTALAMREAYVDCDVLVFPSLHEGFGLPLIEAQATGRPVLTSDLEPMRSVTGGAACLINPLDTASIRSGLNRLLTGETYREQLVEKGLLNAKEYELSAVAGQYAAYYDDMIKAQSKKA